jgi:hypothetical protein
MWTIIFFFLFSYRLVHSESSFWLLVACLALLLSGWLLVGGFSGMYTIKVHEWCLVCYGWLDVCLRSNFYVFLPLQFLFHGSFALGIKWVPVLHT